MYLIFLFKGDCDMNRTGYCYNASDVSLVPTFFQFLRGFSLLFP